ncbi:SLC2A6 [Lepeophtheirus salmonis]|uniref:SLC2A6 n=1 Tax=Lepeophtheirus salmonis TaxID=72036 RepID=A0A7R8CF35_LEPSM|nr:SLC2A6 [Lepeophtheirus salmonis]CAF2757412.1 SLC2A6 [Lepeophtheirus salmonis]
MSVFGLFRLKHRMGDQYEELVSPRNPSGNVIGQMLVCITANLISFSQGFIISTSSILLPQIQEIEGNKSIDGNISITMDEGSWFASLHCVGFVIGSLVGGLQSDYLGRKKSQSFWIVFRYLGGHACGSTLVALSAYNSEISHTSIRGVLYSMQTSLFYLGNFWITILGYLVPWRIAVGVCTAFPLIIIIDEANEEMKDMEHSLTMLDKSENLSNKLICEKLVMIMKDFKNPSFWKPLLLVIVLIAIISVWCGVSFITLYLVSFLSKITTITVAVHQFLLTKGYACEWGLADYQIFHWIPIISIIILYGAVAIGFAPAMRTLQGELLPASKRSLGGSIIGLLEGLMLFILNKLAPMMIENMCVYGCFSFFCWCSVHRDMTTACVSHFNKMDDIKCQGIVSGHHQDCDMDCVETMTLENSLSHKGQILVCAICNLLSLMQGCVVLMSSTILPQIQTDDPKKLSNRGDLVITIDQGSWFASLFCVGYVIGALFGGIQSDFIGRRKSLMIDCLTAFTGAVVIALANSFSILLIGRYLGGHACGSGLVSLPAYNSEISHPSLRGTLSGMLVLLYYIGTCLMTTLGALFPWRYAVGFSCIIPILNIVGLYFSPESPVWLIRFGYKDRATRKETVITLNGYVNLKLPIDAYIAAAFLSYYRLCFGFASLYGMFKIRRRVMALGCLSFMVLGNATTALYQYLLYQGVWTDWGLENNKFINWFPIFPIMMLYGAMAFGFGPSIKALQGELLPSKKRSFGGSILGVFDGISLFVVTKATPTLLYYLKLHGCFTLFACILLSGLIATYFFMPETQGKHLSEIEKFYGRIEKDGIT